jgi:hypothetical protein
VSFPVRTLVATRQIHVEDELTFSKLHSKPLVHFLCSPLNDRRIYVAATDSTLPTFEPILNIPAFSVVLMIGTVVALFQIRIRAIEQASQQRTVALQHLRSIQVKSLSAVGEDAIPSEDVQNAIEVYRQRYQEVEKLRQILPGVRIIPPSQSNTRRMMDDNEKAAQQFLGIVPTQYDNDDDDQGNNDIGIDRKKKAMGDKGLTTFQKVIIAFIVLSQCSLLFFLTLDPLTSNHVLDFIDAVTGME